MKQEKIKVVHLITMLELGGAQQNTLYTISHLDNEVFEVYLGFGPGGILTEEAHQILHDKATEIPHLIRPINPLSDIRALLETYSFLKKIAPHIVHTHSSKAGIIGRTAAWLAGVPVIIHSVHGFGFTPFQNAIKYHILKNVEKIVSKFTTHFICVSQANINQGIKIKLFNLQKVSLIRSGINLSSFTNTGQGTIRKEFSIDMQHKLITMVACFKPQKAPLDFIHAAEKVYQQNKNTRFLLVGDGILKDAITHEIASRNLQETVFLTGWRRDVPEIIAASDVIVLTSLWEGLPRTIIEAIASKKPVVATKVDGTADIIIDGKTGFIADPHDINTISKKILALIENSSLADQFVHNSQNILPEFDINLMVKKQENLYLTLLGSCL